MTDSHAAVQPVTDHTLIKNTSSLSGKLIRIGAGLLVMVLVSIGLTLRVT